MTNKTTIKEAYAQGVQDFNDGLDFDNQPTNYTPLLIELWEEGWLKTALDNEGYEEEII